jgi:GT2 family glycosyltransferase
MNGDDFFDEHFFLYCDDNELAKRVMRKGYKNIMVEGTKILHMSEKSSGVSNKASDFRRYWHRYGWSKCHYARVMHGVLFGKLKAVTIILKSMVLMSKDIVKNGKISVVSKAMFCGAAAYLIGLSAFKNGTSRA